MWVRKERGEGGDGEYMGRRRESRKVRGKRVKGGERETVKGEGDNSANKRADTLGMAAEETGVRSSI